MEQAAHRAAVHTGRHRVSTPVEGGRPLLRGRLLGFPVHLDLSFVIIMAILGYYPGVTLLDMGLWLLITPIAVLTHELGHAVLARAAGAAPEIALAGFGGVTTFTPPGPLSRLRSLGISLAGPAVGLVLGFVLFFVLKTFGDDLAGDSWQHSALRIGIWTCIGWSVLNLLPVLPLDGGQAMRELLPGSPEVRARRAAGVSVVVALVTAAVAYLLFRQIFIALFMVLFAVTNFMAVRQPAAARTRGPADGPIRGPGGGNTPENSVVGLLWQGQPARARELLESVPASTPVDLAVHGAVLALTGDKAQGHALLNQELQRRPGDPNAAALLFLTLALEHDWDGLVSALQSPVGRSVPTPVLDRAIEEAQGTGREDVAGRLRLLAERTANP
jgi:stage IV sporulation protein FB